MGWAGFFLVKFGFGGIILGVYWFVEMLCLTVDEILPSWKDSAVL